MEFEKEIPSANKPIGVFDSGVGGITVLDQAIQSLPSENFIYYADTDHVPYGTKSIEEIRNYILHAAEILNKLSVKALVLACNTATSSSVNELRNLYTFPVIGMEPAVKPAVEKSDGKRVLVLATELTLREHKFKELVARVDNENIVDMKAVPELVLLAEEYQLDESAVMPVLEKVFSGTDVKQYGTIVLGCTHFIFFRNLIKKIFLPLTNIIDGNAGTVMHLKNILLGNQIQNFQRQEGVIRFFESGMEAAHPDRFKQYLRFLRTVELGEN